MERPEVVTERIKAIKYAIKSKAVSYKYHHQDTSLMEAVFARGDRRTCAALIKAFENGAKFDGWSEYFNMDIWNEAMTECNIDPEFYVYRERSYDEVFAWDHIDVGVSKKFLIRENNKAKEDAITVDCRHRCNGCGINSTDLGRGLC